MKNCLPFPPILQPKSEKVRRSSKIAQRLNIPGKVTRDLPKKKWRSQTRSLECGERSPSFSFYSFVRIDMPLPAFSLDWKAVISSKEMYGNGSIVIFTNVYCIPYVRIVKWILTFFFLQKKGLKADTLIDMIKKERDPF